MKTWEAAVAVLRETHNDHVMWGDIHLLHAIAERAGMPPEGPATPRKVLNRLSKCPGRLARWWVLAGNRRVRAFGLVHQLDDAPAGPNTAPLDSGVVAAITAGR